MNDFFHDTAPLKQIKMPVVQEKIPQKYDRK